MHNPYTHILTNIAREHGRDYVTPEDVEEALKTNDRQTVVWAVCHMIASKRGLEDISACAWAACYGGMDEMKYGG